MDSIKVSVNVDLGANIMSTSRTVRNGDMFPVMLMLEHGGLSQAPVTFDTIVLEILFNDSNDVLIRVDPNDRPVAGAIAQNSPTTTDFFSGQQVRSGTPAANPPFSDGTRLSLMGSGNNEPVGPFRGRTGRAGFQDLGTPFVLRSGDPPVGFAMGKAVGGLTAAQPGVSTITATGYALNGGQLVPIVSTKGQITVVP